MLLAQREQHRNIFRPYHMTLPKLRIFDHPRDDLRNVVTQYVTNRIFCPDFPHDSCSFILYFYNLGFYPHFIAAVSVTMPHRYSQVRISLIKLKWVIAVPILLSSTALRKFR